MSKKVKMEDTKDLERMAKAGQHNSSEYAAFINDLINNIQQHGSISLSKILEQLNDLFCSEEDLEGISELSLGIILALDFKNVSERDISTTCELLAPQLTKINVCENAILALKHISLSIDPNQVGPNVANDVVQIIKAVNTAILTKKSRARVFEILFVLYRRFHQKLDPKKFLLAVIGLLEGEDEPGCLLKAFQTIKEFLSISRFSEADLKETELFGLLCAYFPLSFEEESSADENLERKLSKALRKCLAMALRAESEKIHFFLEKYDEFDENCFKIECVLVLNEAAKISDLRREAKDVLFSAKYSDFLVNEVKRLIQREQDSSPKAVDEKSRREVDCLFTVCLNGMPSLIKSGLTSREKGIGWPERLARFSAEFLDIRASEQLYETSETWFSYRIKTLAKLAHSSPALFSYIWSLVWAKLAINVLNPFHPKLTVFSLQLLLELLNGSPVPMRSFLTSDAKDDLIDLAASALIGSTLDVKRLAVEIQTVNLTKHFPNEEKADFLRTLISMAKDADLKNEEKATLEIPIFVEAVISHESCNQTAQNVVWESVKSFFLQNIMVSGGHTELSASFLSEIAKIPKHFPILFETFSDYCLRNTALLARNEDNFLRLLALFNDSLASFRESQKTLFGGTEAEKVAEKIIILNQNMQNMKIDTGKAFEIQHTLGELMAGVIHFMPDARKRVECRERVQSIAEKEIFSQNGEFSAKKAASLFYLHTLVSEEMTERNFRDFYNVLALFWAKSDGESEINLISPLIQNNPVLGRFSEQMEKLDFGANAVENDCVFFLLRVNVLFERTLRFHTDARRNIAHLIDEVKSSVQSVGELKARFLGNMVRLYDGRSGSKASLQFFLEMYFDELKKRWATREKFPTPVFQSLTRLVKNVAAKVDANTQTWRKMAKCFFALFETKMESAVECIDSNAVEAFSEMTVSAPAVLEGSVAEKLLKIVFYLARKGEDPKARLEATKSLMKISSAKILNRNAKEQSIKVLEELVDDEQRIIRRLAHKTLNSIYTA